MTINANPGSPDCCKKGHSLTIENTYVRPNGKIECRTCRAEGHRKLRGFDPNYILHHLRTHCPNGHAYTDANTYITKRNGRVCRQCTRDRLARYRRSRAKAAETAPKSLSVAQTAHYRGAGRLILIRAAQISAERRMARTLCKRGHPLSGDNLYINPRGFRECRACRREASRRVGPSVLDAGEINRVIDAFKSGATIKAVCRGVVNNHFEPEARICSERKLKNTIAHNAKLRHVVSTLAPRNASLAIAQAARSHRKLADASLLRNDGLDAFEAIAAATKHLPDDLRGDVQSAMFIAVGEGRLKLRDAASRVREFVAAHNRQFSAFVPVIGGRMQSLDQQVYDDGPTRLIDTVTQGLWG